MKRKIINSALAVIIAFGFFSCKKEKSIETDSYTFEERYALTSDTAKGILEMNMQVELPARFQNQEVLTVVRNHIVKSIFGEKYTRFPNENLLPQFAEDMKKEYRENNLPFMNEEMGEKVGYAFNNDYMLEGFGLLNDDNIYSYGANIYVYMGGAHGLSSRLYFNYDLSTGRVISQNDLFTQKGLEELPALIKHNIIASNEGINSMEELSEYYWTDEIAPNDNFYINAEGITYVYNPYEIAPYAVGNTEVSIAFDDLKALLKENSIVSYLIKK